MCFGKIYEVLFNLQIRKHMRPRIQKKLKTVHNNKKTTFGPESCKT